jgi:hypothetical protein
MRAAASTTRSAGSASRRTHDAAVTSTAATRVPTAPIIRASVAAGTATRLAGTDVSGTWPNVTSSTGAVATCAPIDTATSDATGRGRRRSRVATRGARTRIPAVADADRASPSDPASAGSTARSTRTATDSACTAWRPVPRASAISTAPAIVAARSTDGAARVSTTNHAMVSAARSRRPRAPTPRPRHTSQTPPATSATFVPDTATRCVRPTSRMRSCVARSSRRVSPITRPTARPARSPSRPCAAACRTRVRTCSVLARSRPGPARTSIAPIGSIDATTCWRRR